MKFTLSITLGHLADPLDQDAIGVLEKITAEIREGQDAGIVQDSNGDTVGEWAAVGERSPILGKSPPRGCLSLLAHGIL